MSSPVDTLLDRHPAFALGAQLSAIGPLRGHPRLPTPDSLRYPNPPSCPLPIERPWPSNRNISLSVGIDERRVVVAVIGFPARAHHRQVLLRVSAEAQYRASSNIQIDVALEVDGAGQERPGGHDHAAAAGGVAGGDGLRYRRGAVGRAAGHRAVALDVEVARREAGDDDTSHD